MVKFIIMIKNQIKLVKNNLRDFDKKIHKKNFITYVVSLVVCIVLIFVVGCLLDYPFNIGLILIILIIYGLFSHTYKDRLSIDSRHIFKRGDFSENKILKEVKEYTRQAVPRNRNLKLNIGAKVSVKDKIQKFRNKIKKHSDSNVSTDDYIEVE